MFCRLDAFPDDGITVPTEPDPWAGITDQTAEQLLVGGGGRQLERQAYPGNN